MNTAKKNKNKRLASYNNYIDGLSKESIEIDEYGTMFWKAEDYSELFKLFVSKKGLNYFVKKENIEKVLNDVENDYLIVNCSFPVDIYFVENFFEKCGRILDRSLLPENVCLFPYGEYSPYDDCIALRIIRDQESDRKSIRF